MKGLIARFLLGRGVGKLQEVVSKAVRHGLTTYGGVLIGQGALTADDLTTVQAAASIVIGGGLSLARTFLASKVG